MAKGKNIKLSAVKATKTPLDLDSASPDPRWRAYTLHEFQFNHVWGCRGYPSVPPYRAKLTLWCADFVDPKKTRSNAIAELFFYDESQQIPANPKPNSQDIDLLYELHFAASTLDSILQQLRYSKAPIALCYYDLEWAVATQDAEYLGSYAPTHLV